MTIRLSTIIRSNPAFRSALTSALVRGNFDAAADDIDALWAAVTAGSAPLVNGDLPGPTLMADGNGQCIMVPLF